MKEQNTRANARRTRNQRACHPSVCNPRTYSNRTHHKNVCNRTAPPSGGNWRVGHGYDVHRLVKGRRCIIGGVEISHECGLLGHSDADVLTHAVIDAILGALALGDIGQHFPDSDARYQDADSIALLRQVASLMRERGWQVGNLDATVIAQAPKLAPYIPQMRERLAKALAISVDRVSVKATTEEGLGFTGTQEGVAAHCICLLKLA